MEIVSINDYIKFSQNWYSKKLLGSSKINKKENLNLKTKDLKYEIYFNGSQNSIKDNYFDEIFKSNM